MFSYILLLEQNINNKIQIDRNKANQLKFNFGKNNKKYNVKKI